MRIRSALAVAVGTGVLVLALPAVASAATGEFTYKHVDRHGYQHTFRLTDPSSRECITLPHVGDEWATPPADSPHNRTDATATVFTGRHCDGEWYSLRPFGGRAGERLKLRSVVFS